MAFGYHVYFTAGLCLTAVFGLAALHSLFSRTHSPVQLKTQSQNPRRRWPLALLENFAAVRHDLDKKCRTGLQTMENYELTMKQKSSNVQAMTSSKDTCTGGPFSFNWTSDRTYCGAVFNTLRYCVALSSDYGPIPLPNYYLSDPGEKLKTGYHRADIAYVHLPKTGGTSVEQLLRKYLLRGNTDSQINKCSPIVSGGFAVQAALSLLSAKANSSTLMKARGSQLLKNAIKLIVEKQNVTSLPRISSSRKVYTSKRTFGIHNFVHKSRDFLYFTWFRHPISKVLSYYYYMRSPKGSRGGMKHCYSGPISIESPSVAELVRHPHIRRIPQYNNHFVRLLTFGEFPDLDSQFDDFPQSMVSLENDLPEIREEHYLAAKRNLDTKFAFIGMLEEFALSQQMLCQLLGISCPSGAVHANANKHRKPETEINAEDRKILEELNYWDLKLYSHVLNIFEEQRAVYNKQKTAI
eukprot:m.273237 g.273237  ORF g.273237 m.273237 type:complete len:466 (+) comp40571_c0_seq3:128-1525(+)